MSKIRIWRGTTVMAAGALLLSGCFFPPPAPDPEPTLVSIAVSPTNPSIAFGETQLFTAVGTFSDGDTENLDATAAWSSSNAGIPISTDGPTRGTATGSAAGTTTITATESGVSGSTTLTVTKDIVSIAISPQSASLPNLGDSTQYTATATYTDASTDDVTEQASFTASVPAGSELPTSSYLSISTAPGSNGLVTRTGDTADVDENPSNDVDTVTITATLGSLSASAPLGVPVFAPLKDDPIITPADASIAAVDGTVQLTLTSHYFGGAFVNATELATWSVVGTGATVSNAPGSKGLVTRTSASAGSVQLRAVHGSAVATVTVLLP